MISRPPRTRCGILPRMDRNVGAVSIARCVTALLVGLVPAVAAAQTSNSPSSLDPPPFTAAMPPPPPSKSTRPGSASEPVERGFVLGLRLGYGAAFGRTSDETGGTDLRRALGGTLPVQLIIAYRALPWFQLGFAGAIGPLFVSDLAGTSCDGSPGRRCGGFDARISVGAQVHLLPARRLDPWLGLGFGYEILRVDSSDDSPAPGGVREFRSEFGGTSYLEAEAGLDVRVVRGLGVGPYLGLTLARFAGVNTWADGQPDSQRFAKPAFHQWLIAGIGARYTF